MGLFGSSGTRGLAPADIGPSFVTEVAAAAAGTFGAETIALARDTRTTGPLLADAAAAGLRAAGVDVHDLGVVPTPGVQVYADANDLPGLIVTASHNPPEYNGVKLIDPSGVEADVETYDAVEAAYRSGTDLAAWNDVGQRLTIDEAVDTYVQTVVDAAPETVSETELTVAIDPGHGAGSTTSPRIFRSLDCAVRTLNAQADGQFPGRRPEPVPAVLEDMGHLVRAAEADLGIAHDGDADRAVFADETGAVIDPETSLAALAAATLTEGDAMVAAVNVSQRVVDAVEDAGARIELTPIGSTHIVTRVRELQADGLRVPIAGEGNGGIAFPPFRLARDGAYTAVRFLALVAETPASQLAKQHGSGYHTVRRNVPHEGREDAAMEAVAATAREAAEAGGVDLTTIDGYRLDYDQGWVLARASGTEPVIRIRAEGRDRASATDLVEWLAGVVEEAIETP